MESKVFFPDQKTLEIGMVNFWKLEQDLSHFAASEMDLKEKVLKTETFGLELAYLC